MKRCAACKIEKPFEEPRFKFAFPDCGELPPPLISVSDVSFSYSGQKKDYLFSKINFGIASDSRICLVGPNGAGKSTLLKLLDKELNPTEGTISTKGGITVARYTQHSDELLDYSLSPVEFMRKSFKDRYPKYEEQNWRSCVGGWGLASDYHYQPISILSAGLKQRLVFAYLAMTNPHVLLVRSPLVPEAAPPLAFFVLLLYASSPRLLHPPLSVFFPPVCCSWMSLPTRPTCK